MICFICDKPIADGEDRWLCHLPTGKMPAHGHCVGLPDQTPAAGSAVTAEREPRATPGGAGGDTQGGGRAED